MSARLNRRNRLNRVESLEDRQLMAADLWGAIQPTTLPHPMPAPALPEIQIANLPGSIDLDHLDLDLDDFLPVPSPVVGTWTNVDADTRGITKLTITNTPSGHKVEAWGACTPSDCDWGKVDLDLLGTSVDDTTMDYAIGSWDFDFKDTTLTIDLNGAFGQVADFYNVFHDGSGRENYHTRYLMTDGGKLIELNDFGNDQLADVLVGGWVNSDVDTRGLTKLAISVDDDGAPQVNAWGSCTPTDCNWNTVDLEVVGSSVVDETPEYAIANYEFDFKSTFLTSRFEDGNLIVGTFNVFHDGSDRSNYYSEAVMWKLGDANHDGEFNTSDLVKIMQAGEYEDGIDGNSSWEEGDFNRDGDFTTADLIAAFECGGYESSPLIGKIRVPDRFPLPHFDPSIRFEAVASAVDDLFSPDNLDDLLLPPLRF